MNERLDGVSIKIPLRCVTLEAQNFQRYPRVLTSLLLGGSTRKLSSLNIPWKVFLPQEDFFSEIYLIASRDWNELNYGIFFVRMNEWSINFLTQVTTFPRSRPDVNTSEDVEIARNMVGP